ncbi:MAG TPA: hypothetical protein V6C88_21550 [Chroococcidiopsis sp.]
MLKSLRATLILSAFALPFLGDASLPAHAQERQGCFMVDDRGQLVDLSSICPQPEPFQASSSSGTPTLGTGDIQVTLRWATVDDVDLAVTDPSGATIFYGARSAPSGGQLDVDANAGCAEANPQPIENIFWPTGQAPQGSYTVAVNLFTRCGATTGPIPFELRILVQGDVQTLSGSVSDQSPVATFPFSLPNN